MDGGLLGHAHLTDPRPFWKKPRNESLRLRGKPFGFWVATCYDDALMFARNPQCFSWELELAFGLALSTRGGRDAGAGVGFLSMIQDDRPDPGRLPRVPSRVFPPRRIAAMDPRIRGRAGQPVSKLRQRHAEGGVSRLRPGDYEAVLSQPHRSDLWRAEFLGAPTYPVLG